MARIHALSDLATDHLNGVHEGVGYVLIGEASVGDLILTPRGATTVGERVGLVLEPRLPHLARAWFTTMRPSSLDELRDRVDTGEDEFGTYTEPAALGLPDSDVNAVRLIVAARSLTQGVSAKQVEVYLSLGRDRPGEWLDSIERMRMSSTRASGLAMATMTTLRRAEAVGLNGHSASPQALLDDVLVLAPSGSLCAGDLAYSVVVVADDGQLTAQLGLLEDTLRSSLTGELSTMAPRPELEGAYEHAAGSPLADMFRDRLKPELPIDVCIARPFDLALGPGGSRRLTCWQITVYFEAPQVAGWSLNSVPPVTWLVAAVVGPSELLELDLAFELLSFGRARVFGDEYVNKIPTGSADALPFPWASPELEKSVQLVVDPTRALLAARKSAGSAKRIEQLYFATVAAKGEIIRQQLAINQRADGATWKVSLFERDLQHLYGDLTTPVNQDPVYSLLSPVRHHVSQLNQVSAHLEQLSLRSEELFGLLSTHANRELLSRTDGAKRIAIVAGVVTGFLAIVGTFATLAAIPAQQRLVDPLTRAMDIIGLVGLVAVIVGLIAGAVAQHAAAVDPLAPEVETLAPLEAPPVIRRWLEILLVAVALMIMLAVAVVPDVWLFLAAPVLVLLAVGVHLYRERF